MAKAIKPRVYVSSLEVHIRELELAVKGRLTPIKRSTESDIKMCTPEGKPVYRRHIDDEGSVYEDWQLERAVVNADGEYRIIDKEELKRAKASSLESNVLNLAVHKKSDTEGWLVAAEGNAYIYEPVIVKNKRVVQDSRNEASYDLLQTLVYSDRYTFLTKANVHGVEAIFKLIPWRGYVALQRQEFPSGLWNTYKTFQPQKVTAANRKAALAAVDALVTEFDPEAYVDEVAERVELVKSEDYTPDMISTENEFSVSDLVKLFAK